MSKFWQTYRFWISLSLLLILYSVGLVGLQTSSREWFLAATPLTLVISTIALLLNQEKWNISLFFFAIFAALTGFLVEVIGVKTGAIFGNYSYGETLGLKLFSVPLVIALNWLLLSLSSGALIARLEVHWAIKIAIGASLMTILDILIEPIAIALDFWTWESAQIPMQNYLAWWIISAIMLFAFDRLKFKKDNRLALPIMLIQFLFFGCLQLLTF